MPNTIIICNNSTKNKPVKVVVPDGYELVSREPVVVTSDNITSCLVKNKTQHGGSRYSRYAARYIGLGLYGRQIKRFQVRKI